MKPSTLTYAPTIAATVAALAAFLTLATVRFGMSIAYVSTDDGKLYLGVVIVTTLSALALRVGTWRRSATAFDMLGALLAAATAIYDLHRISDGGPMISPGLAAPPAVA
jgi:hypothetical protein